jgi:ABC-type Fe3+ transport system permease subunit
MPSEATLPVRRVPAGRFGIRLRRIGHRLRIPLFCYIALLPVPFLYAHHRVQVRPEPVSLVMISPRLAFVGLTTTFVFGDEFHPALKNTTIYSFATVILTTVLALPAVFLARRSQFRPLPDDLLPASDHAADPDVDRVEVDLRLQLRRLNYLLSFVNLPAVACSRSIQAGCHHDGG